MSLPQPNKNSLSILSRLSVFLKALWIFSPGVIFLLLGLFIFTGLPQGKDIIYQSTDGAESWKTGTYLVLATIFWVFTTWYTSRLIAYNRNDLYHWAPWVLYHFPRLLGFCIFLVLWIAVFLLENHRGQLTFWAWAVALLDLALYLLFYRGLERSLLIQLSPKRRRRLATVRLVVIALILLSCLVVIALWNKNKVWVLLYTLPVFQFGFLFLVIVRQPLFMSKPSYVAPVSAIRQSTPLSWSEKYMRWAFLDNPKKFSPQLEKRVFLLYHVMAFLAMSCYLLAINHLPFARELTSFPLALLAFGIMLGVINLIALLSYRKRINFNFLLLLLIVLAGFLFETHEVRLLKNTGSEPPILSQRMSMQQYAHAWVKWHQKELDSDTTKPFPLFFVLADGGASRSGYWAAKVLSKLHEQTRYTPSGAQSFFMDHLFCLSGASGGSVGNTVFLSSYVLQQKNPSLKTTDLSASYLKNDFLAYPLARLLGPEIIQPLFGWLSFWGDRAYALEHGMDYPAGEDESLGHFIRHGFSQLLPNDNNHLPILSINTTRVNDGGPGVVSTIDVGGSRGAFGKRIDVLDSIPAEHDLRISTAMVLGARFPYMSPGGKLGKSYYVDGGYFDNSGAGIVHEMLLELNRMMVDPQAALYKYANRLHFYVIHLSNSPYGSASADASIHPTLNDLATPLLTLAGSYSSQTSVNDARLMNYLKESDKRRNSYLLFNLYNKSGQDSAVHLPMNWVISKKSLDKMDASVQQKKNLDTIINRVRSNRHHSLFEGIGVEN